MLTLQFGQCGNQLGHALLSKISSDIDATSVGISHNANYEYIEKAFEKWFTGITKDGKRLSRAILIDTENKVVNRVCNNLNSPWTYHLKNVICRASGGCANNWAFGYLVKAREFLDVILETTRQELEKIDHFDGFLQLLSSAGGTGSGVGSLITESLRDEFPTKTISSVIILPYASGEVGPQSYNTLLTVAKLYDTSDMILLFENEQINAICTSMLKNFDIQLQDLNEVIAEKLAAVFQPIKGAQNDMVSLVSQITPHPSYKLTTVKSTPHIASSSALYEIPYKWKSYIDHLKQTLRISSYDSDLTDMETKMPSRMLGTKTTHTYCRSVSNTLITRGKSMDSDPIICDDLQEKQLYVNWVPRETQFNHMLQTRCLCNREKFLALLTNNSQLHRPINATLEKAWNVYTHAAFLHQYKQHGLEEDDFLQAFAKVENVAKIYKELHIDESN